MSWRRQLAVASPISIAAVARAAVGSARGARPALAAARALIRDRYGASSVVPTDSGTSALVLALQLAVPRGGVVGFPGYACVDLAAAALFAGVRVRLYDVDPATLSADLDSVDRVLQRGVDAIVVAHLFGYPADVPAVRAHAAAAGVTVIEDAAQGAGGTLGDRPLGSLGDVSVLSFGRGKGLCAGGGGALLGFGAAWDARLAQVQLPAPGFGWAGLAKTAVQWGLGRPSLYAIPSMIPGLRLGEMVYHPASRPGSMSRGSSALLASAFARSGPALAARRLRARALESAARDAPRVAVAHAIAGSEPGYLRFPVRDVSGARHQNAALGILRSYPQTLAEQPQLAPILVPGEPETPGSVELRRSLFTLPTHAFVTDADVAAMRRWLEGAGSIPQV